ncbi:DUF2975 domain-containing protein [Sphingomonas sp. KR1UV-12]|uniref:DUF2975 domain-containing protein n=1 Tax=Sphingomonas aurea TaxID=3063994 RepID=A0ABT9EMQ4_9SPHN|nr:DUF2975 domain-containing protein [Sphingomonas sp. KR1UV-12]MDP1028102.1 DUF2975 domain-containing protein [Sphingomonas sp. KR1UV-12]
MRWGERVLRWLVIANFAFGVIAVLCLAASFPGEAMLAAQLVRKYGAGAPVMTLVWELRAMLLLGAVAVWPIDRCLRPLADVARSVRRGEPFDPANAVRVMTIGWGLLGVQLLDLALGLLTGLIAHSGADVAGWQPSLAGWICVPVAFVLARVFAAGARMRDDLEGTV